MPTGTKAEMPTKMPQVLYDFLMGLGVEDADDVWIWAEGVPSAVSDIISVVAPKVLMGLD